MGIHPVNPTEEGIMSAKVLMPVFNEIDYDGRVQRAAEAIGQNFDVTVCSVDSNHPYHNALFKTRLWKRPARLKNYTLFCSVSGSLFIR